MNNRQKLSPEKWTSNWNLMATELFGLYLDEKQKEILEAIQKNPRVSIASGHARGKDFLGATAGNCFLYSYYPSKVIVTAPTGRQVVDINMSEIGRIWKNAKVPLGGILQTQRIKFPDDPDWFLEGFKAFDKDAEAWAGYHSPHIMVIVTEASGITDETFTAIEGILTGTVVKLLLVGNRNRTVGEFHKSFTSPRFKHYTLSCLDAPNVVNKKIIIPGQVDYEWVKDKVDIWADPIDASEAVPEEHDFEFEGQWYRPSNKFLIRVLGQPPREASNQLIPLSWVLAANERWRQRRGKGKGEFRLGSDIAGMGRDKTVDAHRRGMTIEKLEKVANPGRREDIHMTHAGRIKNKLKSGGEAFVDAIGEGAGVHARLLEQGVKSTGVKFSRAAKDANGRPLTDISGMQEFKNMRAYCYWAVRDALDPKNEGERLALPPDDELTEELNEVIYSELSDGRIMIEPKDDIKERLGRSTDSADSVAMTFAPSDIREYIREI